MQKSFTLFLLNSLCFCLPVFCQFQGTIYERAADITVNKNTSLLLGAWCGGINSIQINHADINNDGKKDLVLYDNNSEVVRTFLNTGIANEMKYSYQPQYEKNFSFADNYLILKDYNCDNIPDAFCKGSPGVTVYKGYYQGSELKFNLYKKLYYQDVSGLVNVYVQPTDIPSIEDIDGDGDLDVCSYEVNGFYLSYYKNNRVEESLPCDSIKMVYADKCWGKFYQGVYRTLNKNILCKGGNSTATAEKKHRHPKNTVLHIDIDNDGDLDVLDGNVAYSDIQLYINNGSDLITAEDTLYNSSGHQLKMPSWPASFLADIDNDGDKDLLFTAHNDDLNIANFKTIDWYKNTGTATNPSYNYVQDTLLMKDIIDVGSYSYPTFFDYDKDGKKDLFIGTEGYYNNNADTMLCKMSYYKNTSTSTNISFDFITDDFLNLGTKNYKGIFPTFGDITGDGVDDLVFGNVKGNFAVYKNTAVSNTVQANFQFTTDSLAVPSPGKYATPAIYDFNNDGKADLLSGNQIGNLVYYKDTSATSVKELKLITATLANVKAGEPFHIFGYSAPFITKMDNLDSTYLLIGNIDGKIERYDSFRNNLVQFKKIDMNYSYITTPSRSVPAIADMNNDGKYEMLIGNKLGGLLLYKQTGNVGLYNTGKNDLQLTFYPNPCKGELYVLHTGGSNDKIDIIFFDILGKKIKTYSLQATQTLLDISDIKPGFYFVESHSGKKKSLQKIVVQ